MLMILLPETRSFFALVFCITYKSLYIFFKVCLGCCGDMKRGLELAKETPGLVRRSNNQLEKFLLRRAQKMLEDEPTQQYCLLLAYELLYLWNALGACLKHSHLAIQIGKQLQESY